jgi:hypothetical protein
MPQQLYLQGKGLQYPSNRLGEPHSKCEYPLEDKNLLFLAEINHDSLVVQFIAYSLY